MKTVKRISIIPAVFLKKTINGYFLRLLHDNGSIEEKEFYDYSLLEGIENPKYLLIGRMSGFSKRNGKLMYTFEQYSFTNANDMEKMFIKKWNKLLE